ncbi:hypothetical protein GCM10007338_17010 [Corynebacterium pelargi]|nr:hypothetical protein GCM10007338_17010 [Corynebacterium pelargi]
MVVEFCEPAAGGGVAVHQGAYCYEYRGEQDVGDRASRAVASGGWGMRSVWVLCLHCGKSVAASVKITSNRA